VEGAVAAWKGASMPVIAVSRARKRLEEELAGLGRRVLAYRIFPSPLGNLLIALSDRGVSLIEYLGQASNVQRSRLARLDVEAVEGGPELEKLYRELLDYLEGRRTRLEWPLDFRLVESEFRRAVLRTTAAVPYGAVTSYAHVARELGKPAAVRAVAQALRWNPLPIVVPCHRIIGTSGALTGYAGDKLSLKEQLLATEGVRVEGHRRIAPRSMYVETPDHDYYCLPSCGWLRDRRDLGRLVLFGSRRGAEAAGLQACGECRPDLHPLE
jgi:methylated-DNA-[protein]-cysteine S-methyltransferase